MILLDSNILIGYLNGNENIIKKLLAYRQDEVILFISAITVTEVLALASLTLGEIKIIETFLSEFVILSVTGNIAKQAATLRRRHKISVPDALIASTAQLHLIPLITADVQLHKIPRLKTINLK
jgi:predicted nucleic acid-binding protein